MSCLYLFVGSCGGSSSSDHVRLCSMFSQLNTKDQVRDSPSLHTLQNPSNSVKYILPATLPKTMVKTILDPVSHNSTMSLAFLSIEKLTPSFSQIIVPIKDPTPKSKPVIEKKSMAILMRIRHKKMKKHKLRKLRKRMIFTNRKLTAIKNKKKEAKIVEKEKAFLKSAQDFDAEKYVEERLSSARRGDWSVDIVKTWKNQRHNNPE